MAKWYYEDAEGLLQGAFTKEQIQWLVIAGDVKPDTLIEIDTGYRGAARLTELDFSPVASKKSFISRNSVFIRLACIFIVLGILIWTVTILWRGLILPLLFLLLYIAPLLVGLTVIVLLLGLIGNGISSSTTKGRCQGVGGLFIIIGIVLSCIGGKMETHNRSLLADIHLAEREKQRADRQLRSTNIAITDQVEQALEYSRETANEMVRAKLALRNTAHSTELIYLLCGLGVFLFLFGFILIVVGWILSSNKPLTT